MSEAISAAIPFHSEAMLLSSRATSDRIVTSATTEPRWVQVLLISAALLFLAGFLFLPLLLVFVKALGNGLPAFIAAVTEADALAAIKLTLLVTLIVLPLNLVFGIAAAWAVSKH